MKYKWIDLPKPMNVFTVRSAVMMDIDTKKIVRQYSANVKLVVTQKCITPTVTFYRTSEAARHHLNYAFAASAFGLPNEKAPLATNEKKSLTKVSPKKVTVSKNRTQSSKKTQKQVQKPRSPKSGEEAKVSFWKKLFRRYK